MSASSNRGYSLGTRYRKLTNFEPPVMRLDADVRRCVVFIGQCSDGERAEETFRAAGTAFFIAHQGMRFLVTAAHVAIGFGDSPFYLRINRTDGTSDLFHCDPTDDDELHWLCHEDPNVDLAVLPFNFKESALGLDMLAISDQLLIDDGQVAALGINVGELCYGVGLFRLLQGSKRNVPIVHTGNIALMPGDEAIPVRDWTAPPGSGAKRLVRGYLVEMQNLKGLSGSPVLVRSTTQIYAPTFERDGDLAKPGPTAFVAAHDADVYLLGVWSASWDAPTDEVAATQYGADTRVPIGLGTVVPSGRLIELFNSPATRSRRARWDERAAAQRAATPDAAAV